MKNSLLKNKAFYIMLLFCLVVIGVGVYVNKNQPKDAKTNSTVTRNLAEKKDVKTEQKKHSNDKINNKQDKVKKNNESKNEQKKVENTVKDKKINLNVKKNNKKQSKVTNGTINKVSTNNVNNNKVLGISTVSKNENEILTDPLADGKLLKPYSIRPQYSLTLEEPKMHQAIDIQGKVGQEIRAAAGGTIETVFNDQRLGETVVILHDKNIRTQYSNLNKDVLVKQGQKVKTGDVIGVIGSTARYECMDKPHLHFSVTYANQVVDPSCYFVDDKTAVKYKKDPAIEVMTESKDNKKETKPSSAKSNDSKTYIQYGSNIQD